MPDTNLSALISGDPRQFLELARDMAPEVLRYLNPDDPNQFNAPRLKDESLDDYALRREADDASAVLVLLSRVMYGAKGAAAIQVLDIIQRGLFTVSTLMKNRRHSEMTREAFREWLDSVGLFEGAGESALSQFITFCVELLPRLMAHGVKIDDHMASLLIDDSGKLDIRNIIYEANSAVVYANKNLDGVPDELVDAIADHVSDPNATAEGLKRKASEILGRPGKDKLRGFVESYRRVDQSDGVVESGFKVTIFLPNGDGIDRLEGRSKHWLDLAWAEGVKKSE